MVPPDPEEGFKVTDRRRQPADDEAPVSEPGPRRPHPPAEPAQVEHRGPSGMGPAPDAGSSPGRDLTGLFVMLASSAAMALGEAPDPMTGEVHRDLGQAAELIDLLVLLREKTEGRRTAEESQVLDEVIYDVQLRYVAATRRSAPRPGPPRP
jgi:hypothetical protein